MVLWELLQSAAAAAEVAVEAAANSSSY